MKVLISPSYGGIYFTDEMKRIMSRYSFPKNRTGDIVDYVESTTLKFNGEGSLKEFVKENVGSLVCYNNKHFYTWCEEYRYVCRFEIVDVDITKPWCISEYDGKEYIDYLDYKIIEKEMNYATH